MIHCPDCDKPVKGRTCRACGWQASGGKAEVVNRCATDGALLRFDGWCEAGAGYPVTATCPVVCPICRHRLDWSGACSACYGTPTGRREAWRFPGDRHELVSGHWQRVEGPRPAVSPEVNGRCFRVIYAMLAHRTSAAEGSAEITRLLEG